MGFSAALPTFVHIGMCLRSGIRVLWPWNKLSEENLNTIRVQNMGSETPENEAVKNEWTAEEVSVKHEITGETITSQDTEEEVREEQSEEREGGEDLSDHIST